MPNSCLLTNEASVQYHSGVGCVVEMAQGQFSPEGLNFPLPITNLQHSNLTSPGACTEGLREVTVSRDLVSPDTQLIKSQEKNCACP